MAFIARTLDQLSSSLTSALRPGAGRDAAVAAAGGSEPQLELYEFEACPFCRKVREAICALDLRVDIRPCPKRGERFRPEVLRRGGKASFPYLVDRSSGVELYESDDIVAYLFERYGRGASVPSFLRPGPLTDASAALSLLPRFARGGFTLPSRAAERPLELWSVEADPACRRVRERLCSLELPYRLTSVGRGSAHRAELDERKDGVQLPLLRDPNLDVELAGADWILCHLDREYAARA